MLKVEYSLLPQDNSNKNVIIWNEAKKHLHDVRIRRQKQLELTIHECERLQHVHRQIFNSQLEKNSLERSTTNKQIKYVMNESPLLTKKYAIPRIEYASILYRRAIPLFEIDKSVKKENQSPLIKDLIDNLSDSSSTNSSCQFDKYSPSQYNSTNLQSSKRKNSLKCPSISPVPSLDKQVNRVYEKWPDYDHISQIVGYRIEPPLSKTVMSNSISSRPSQSNIRRKSNKSSSFSSASKQVKTVLGLNSSPNRRRSSKFPSIPQLDLTPIIIDQPKPLQIDPPKDLKPQLPTCLCPSSLNYSHRIQTRQWLIKNNFSPSTSRTRPLL